MTATALLDDLCAHQSAMLGVAGTFDDDAFSRQFHSDLSPVGWHLGHCVYTELFWIRETVLGRDEDSGPLKDLYVPELSPKPHRGAALPERDAMLDWCADVQRENADLLARLYERAHAHVLLRRRFLLRFLIQHYAQHLETVQYILAQRRLAEPSRAPANAALSPAAVRTGTRTVPGGRYRIGATEAFSPYDNEHPALETELHEFNIGTLPISNAEYLGFVMDGGYDDEKCWSAEGWRWREKTRATAPLHWRCDGTNWYGVDDAGPVALAADAPVYGISHHEALAFANRAGARLPHEYEWETAARAGALDRAGEVWEWCANPFHAYPGFRAWPYEGYSVPYFDGAHFTLRGGSLWTRSAVRRPSFRNYYEAGKRHVRAGLRLVFD